MFLIFILFDEFHCYFYFGFLTWTYNNITHPSVYSFGSCGSFKTSLVGVVLLQKGIYCLGASLTAILSTLEPITSIVVGVVWLNESLTLLKIIGCILVLFSTFILVKAQNQKEDIQ